MTVKALREYTIRKLRLPVEKKAKKDIEWICASLGFVTERDKDRTAYRIMHELIKEAKKGKGLTSEEITKRVKPTIGSVIYHLKKLSKSGLVVKFGSEYELRMKNLNNTINEIQREVNTALEDMKKVAVDVDKNIGLGNR